MKNILSGIIIMALTSATTHTTAVTLQQKLALAHEVVTVGDCYYHYKSPEKLYKVIALALQEASEEVCVIYQSLGQDGLIWVRNLDLWLSQIEYEGKRVSRFQKKTEKKL